MVENDIREPVEGEDEWQLLKDAILSNGTRIALGIGAVLIMIIAVSVYRGRISGRLEEASTRLTNARSLDDLEVLVEDYPSTPTAPLALLKLAKGYFNSGNYDTALSKYSDFQRIYAKHSMIEIAELGKIHCMEAKGLTEEAITAFASFAAAHPDHYLTPQATLGQGRCLEQIGRLEEAKKIYESFIDEHPESEWLSKAEDILKRLEKDIKKKSQPSPADQDD